MRVAKKRIMIVDDEQAFAEMVKLNLELAGCYAVHAVNDPAIAVSKALRYLPELILLDVIMPSLEGPDLLNEFKRYHRLADIPVIFLTATVTPEEVERAKGYIGGHRFVAKPTEVAELMNCIENELTHAGESA